MPDLDSEIAAYEKVREELELKHIGKWVVFHDEQPAGFYDSFETAAWDAIGRFGRGPYLIRQIGAPNLVLPASVMWHPVHG